MNDHRLAVGNGVGQGCIFGVPRGVAADRQVHAEIGIGAGGLVLQLQDHPAIILVDDRPTVRGLDLEGELPSRRGVPQCPAPGGRRGLGAQLVRLIVNIDDRRGESGPVRLVRAGRFIGRGPEQTVLEIADPRTRLVGQPDPFELAAGRVEEPGAPVPVGLDREIVHPPGHPGQRQGVAVGKVRMAGSALAGINA